MQRRLSLLAHYERQIKDMRITKDIFTSKPKRKHILQERIRELKHKAKRLKHIIKTPSPYAA